MSRSEEIVRESVEESRQSRLRRMLVVLGVLCALFFVGLMSAMTYAYVESRQSAEDGVSLAQKVQAACDDPKKETKDLGTLCNSADKVVESAPASVKGDKGDTGPSGTPGRNAPAPTNAQIQRAVDLYCSTGRCKANSVTTTQVRTAVASYCGASGRCQGPRGSAGEDGNNGANGQPGSNGAPGSDGSPGPSPSESQIEAAVESYCSAHDGCQGPRGQDGPAGTDGKDGAAGRGILSVECSAGTGLEEFKVTYSDGTVDTFGCSPPGASG